MNFASNRQHKSHRFKNKNYVLLQSESSDLNFLWFQAFDWCSHSWAEQLCYVKIKWQLNRHQRQSTRNYFRWNSIIYMTACMSIFSLKSIHLKFVEFNLIPSSYCWPMTMLYTINIVCHHYFTEFESINELGCISIFFLKYDWNRYKD